MTEDAPALLPRERAALADLKFSWSSEYEVTFTPPSAWRAVRHDDATEVHEATTARELASKLRRNYWPNEIGGRH